MDEKNFLLSILTLSDGIIKEDTGIVAGATDSLNLTTLKDDQQDTVKNIITTAIYNTKGINPALKLAISKINGLNEKYLLSLFDVKMITLSNNFLENKQEIEDKLKDSSIVFDNDRDKHSYYFQLVTLTINLQDSDLIKTAFDRIQSI